MNWLQLFLVGPGASADTDRQSLWDDWAFIHVQQSTREVPTHCCCFKVASVMSDSVRPHRRQPTRLPRPWDSPGKNTGVGCHFLLQCMQVKSESEVAQSCPTLSDPMDCSLPGSSVHGIFQARVLEWVAIAFSIEHTTRNTAPPQKKKNFVLLEREKGTVWLSWHLPSPKAAQLSTKRAFSAQDFSGAEKWEHERQREWPSSPSCAGQCKGGPVLSLRPELWVVSCLWQGLRAQHPDSDY